MPSRTEPHQPFGHEELQAFADILIDGEQIAAMLEPAGEPTTTDSGALVHHFTCRNWNPVTMLCEDYENRPAICRDYPYGGRCEHCGLVDGVSPQERLALERSQA